MPSVGINYWAVVVAAALAFGLGALWYSPLLFAKQWIDAQGFSEDKVKEMRQGVGKVYGITFLANVVMALAMAVLAAYMGLIYLAQGIKLGALIWVGFAATMGLTANLFSDKPIKLFYIDTSYQLVYLVIMGAVITGWP